MDRRPPAAGRSAPSRGSVTVVSSGTPSQVSTRPEHWCTPSACPQSVRARAGRRARPPASPAGRCPAHPQELQRHDSPGDYLCGPGPVRRSPRSPLEQPVRFRRGTNGLDPPPAPRSRRPAALADPQRPRLGDDASAPRRPPRAGGMSDEGVERIWKSARRPLPQRRPPGGPGLRPPRGRGRPRPRDRPRPRQRPRRRRGRREGRRRRPRPRSASTRRSKAITAFVVHKLDRARAARASTTRSPSYIPGYERNGKGEITIGHVLAHRAGVPNLPREALDLDRIDDREYLRRGPLRREAVREAGRDARLPRGLRRLHPRRGRPPGHRQGRSARCSPRRSSTRSASAG